MKAVESEGISVEEAVNRALLLLGLDADQVDIAVLRDPGKNGGGETAIVRVQPKGSAAKERKAVPLKVEAPALPVEEEEDAEAELEPVARRAPAPRRQAARPATGVSGETEIDVSREAGAAPAEETILEDDVPLTDEEGERADRAGDFLEDLFERLDLDCYPEVAADRVEGKILIDIAGPDTAVVIGRKGAMLDAVELVLNRAMDNADGAGIRIALDAESYRVRRAEKLRSVATEQASKVSQTQRPASLEPMSARERRIIHMTLKNHGSVRTRSEGEGPERHIIIEPIRERARR